MSTKNIFRTVCATLALALTLGMTSCSTDRLDIEQHGVDSTNTYATADDTQALQFIAAVYSSITGSSYQAVLGGSGVASYRAYIYELMRMGNESAEGFGYTDGSDGGTYSYIYAYYYRLCYWCSMILENLEDNTVCSADVKTRVLAEARAIRAISMMYLVQLYGNPPLADHVLDGSEGNTPAEESWAWIESEMETAAEDLPSKSGQNGQEAIGGRLTKEAVYAYLGKAQLWQEKYTEAAQTLYNKVISTNLYALVDDFSTLNSSANDFSSENIWEYNFSNASEDATSQDGCFDLCCFSPDLGYYSTTYGSLLMAFGMAAYPSQEFIDFMGAHDATESGTTARYQATIADYPSALMSFMAYFTTYPYSITNCMGYYNVKNMVLASDLTGVFPYYYTMRNTPYMRYAEVLLNYAEAVAEGGTAGSLSGLEALNMVRRRAGLDDAPSLSMDDETYGVKAEREAELYAEGHRFIDLVRWGDAPTVLADCGKNTYTCTIEKIMDYPIDDTTSLPICSTSVTSAATGGPGFKSGKNELFPIPASDINANPLLEQNPGW